ncbi:MAG: hypothetical protein WDM71_03115 [Ferruginibacter sp.]
MSFKMPRFLILIFIWIASIQTIHAQFLRNGIPWTKDGNGYYSIHEDSIHSGVVERTDIKTGTKTVIISKEDLTRAGSLTPTYCRIN